MTYRSEKRPHLLVLTSTFPTSLDDNSPRFIFDLCRRLTADFVVTVLAPHGPGLARREHIDGLDVRRFRYLPQRFENLGYSDGIPEQLRRNRFNYLAVPFFVVAQILSVAYLLREKPISIVHAHWWIPQALSALIGRLLSRKTPAVVCTLHGTDAFVFGRGLMRRLMTLVVGRCNKAFPVSTAVRATLPESIRKRSTTIVAPMGVDLNRTFMPVPQIEPNYRSVLFVGRLAPVKGVAWLLHAFSIAQGVEPALRLIIIGDGGMTKHYKRLAHNLGLTGRVEFAGALPHERLPDFYSQAGMAIFPSVEASGGGREGLGLTAVEALACGCPVIVSDTPSFRDVVEHSHNGLIIPQQDRKALAESIIRLATDPALQRRLRLNARDSIRQFDWGNVRNRYARELRACVTGSVNSQT